MDLKSKQEFVFFMRRALASDADDCYIELYNLLLRSFIAADVDFDGKVDAGEFTGMIESAAALLRKFDSDWWEDGKPREELFRYSTVQFFILGLLSFRCTHILADRKPEKPLSLSLSMGRLLQITSESLMRRLCITQYYTLLFIWHRYKAIFLVLTLM